MSAKKWFTLLLIVFLTGCTVQTTPVIISTNLTTVTAVVISPTATQTLTPTATSIPLVSNVCSPLQDIALSDLRLVTSNPFKFKYPFSEGPTGDENHPAVDLGFFHFKNFTTDVGHPIQALLPGKVVEALDNRFPYGNMILIETPLDQLSPELEAQMQIPQPYSEDEIKIRSNCQPDQNRISWSQASKSVYTLYAHMENPPTLKAGDTVECGQVLGGVGASGHAAVGNEHLHLEIRVGPSDAKFATIADYDASATTEERYNYCIWALSEIFLPIDPSLFWDPANVQGQ